LSIFPLGKIVIFVSPPNFVSVENYSICFENIIGYLILSRKVSILSTSIIYDINYYRRISGGNWHLEIFVEKMNGFPR